MTEEVLPYEPYEILSPIGEGNFSRVYRARHRRLGSIHALKVMNASDNDGFRRMVQEGRIQAQLRHRNIVQVTDLVTPHEREMGLVMEFIEGPSLERVLKDRGALPLPEVEQLFRQVLAGIAAAHGAGVLHRDLKPANILLSQENRKTVAKVTDFGLARPTVREAEPTTQVGFGVGTPGYMAPEQAKDAVHADHRADIFSLGVILYEMASGERPFHRGRDTMATLQATRRGSYRPIDQVMPGCPRTLANAIERALHVDPDQRFSSCDEFAYALFGEALDEDPPSLPVDLGNLRDDSEEIRVEAAMKARQRQPLFSHWTARDMLIGVLLGVGLSGVVIAVLRATGAWH